MLLGSGSIGETHYNVLSLTENASYNEIRASYRSAILNCHPDKLQNEFTTSHHHPNPEDRFLKVQKAWEVLSCSKSRVAYDLELQASKGDAIVAEDVSLDDMICKEEDQVVELFHQCRCGDYFYVDSSELEKMGYNLLRGDRGEVSFRATDASPAFIILPCGSCSLRLRLSINSEHLNFGGGFFEMSNSAEKCKLLIASLKDALCMCLPSDEPLLNSRWEEDSPARNARNVPDEDEVVVLPIQIQSQGKKKLREERMLSKDGLPWVYLFLTGPNAQQPNVEEDKDEFVSVKSGLTCSSISASKDDFLSAKITFSSCSSPDRIEIDFLDSESLRRLSIIQELCHCEGWPFGLCRKLVLFPPLPRSPTDSWSWRKAKIT